MDSTLDSVNRTEELADKLAQESGFDEDDRQRIALAVREAAVNAVYHGNHYDPEKEITVTFESGESGLIVTVRDQGTGMVPDEVPDPLAPENLLRGSGRGVFLMRAFMDEVRFRIVDPGTEVTLVKRRGAATDHKEA
ncbi:MAG: ATP-binding protein [Acidobacteria bacterium]|nr:ATP-binding protein [Acidobacteriota bacterium]